MSPNKLLLLPPIAINILRLSLPVSGLKILQLIARLALTAFALGKHVVGELEHFSKGTFECFSTGFAEEFSTELKCSEIGSEFVF